MERISREELIEDFRAVASKLEKVPTLSEYSQYGSYSSTPIYKRFDSFENLKETAGFETGEKKLDEEKLLADLRRVATDIGRTPPVMVYDELGDHNSKSLKRRYGNWTQVLEAAGLEPTSHSLHWKDNEPAQYGKNYGSIEVECASCGKMIRRKPSTVESNDRFYCDYDCKGDFMSEQTGEHSRRWEGGKVTINCETCDEEIQVRPSKVDTSRFCSQACMIEWRSEQFSGENHPRWRGGYDRYYGPTWRAQRERALARDEYQCQVCGMDEKEHSRKFDCNPIVHHKTRFGDFEDSESANELSNLITLCKTCHGLVEGGRITLPNT